MSPSIKPLSILIAALASTPVAQATGSFELGRIEVTAAQELPALGTTRIDADLMRDENRETLTEALDRVPGVAVGNIGMRNEQVAYIRGFNMRQVPVLVDGMPVYISYDGTVDLGRFTTYDIAEVNVSKGFSSVLYGPNTLGGAINLISRRPSEKFEGEVGAGYQVGDTRGSDGYRVWGNFGSNQGQWYVQTGVSYVDQNAFSLSNKFSPNDEQGRGLRKNAEYRDKKISLKLGWTPNETDEYAISYVKQDGKKNVPTYAGTADERPRYRRWPFWDRESIYFLSNTALDDVSYLKTRLYYDQFDNQFDWYNDREYTDLSRESIYDDYSYGGSLEYGRQISNHLVKVAAHYKFDEHVDYVIGVPDRDKYQDKTYSFAIEDTITLTERQFIVAGVSYDRRDSVKSGEFDNNSTDGWNPQIGYFFAPDNANEGRITLSRKTRVPTMSDRYSTSNGRALPAPDLKPEKATTAEIGWVHRIGTVARLEAAIFHSNIRDLIQRVDIEPVGPARSQNQNVDKVRSRGVELGGEFWLSENWLLGTQYSYLDRKNRSSDLQLTDTPEHTLFAYATWQATPALSLSASAQYESKRFSSTDRERVASSFTVANFRGSYQFGQGFTARFGVENFLDRNYAYTEGWPEPGRTYYANLSYRF